VPGEHYTYLLLNLASLSIPLAASFEPRVRFFASWRSWGIAIAAPGILFIIWDILFTRWGVWGFNERYITGISIFGLPMEELMFFLCIPYACLFTYAALKHLFPGSMSVKFNDRVTVLLVAFLLVLFFFNINRAYTATTFLLLAVMLVLHRLSIRDQYLGRFYLTYLVLLLPFFLINGILTGSFIEEEVVWYNNDENLGLRIFTIPVEDIFYGMLLILLNVTIFECLTNRKSG
jgi:lycopene cyclase domain-containing protein